MKILLVIFLTGCITAMTSKKESYLSYNAGKKPIPPSIKIINDYTKIYTVQQMLSHFKGKIVLIDLWATWCEPCIEAFMHSDSLYTFTSGNGVELLYVSIDNNEMDSIWRNDIYRYQLYGNHIRATKNLQNEICTLIWGAKDGYSIPHYIIFDKEGKIVNKNASPPGEWHKLYEEIAVSSTLQVRI